MPWHPTKAILRGRAGALLIVSAHLARTLPSLAQQRGLGNNLRRGRREQHSQTRRWRVIVELVRLGAAGAIIAALVLFFRWLNEGHEKRNLVAAVLVMAMAIGAIVVVRWMERERPSQLDVVPADQLAQFPYLNEHTVFDIDLTGWSRISGAEGVRPATTAVVTRRDLIRKLTSDKMDYTAEFWTSGDQIEPQELHNQPAPEFKQGRTELRPGESQGQKRTLYELRWPIGAQQNGVILPLFTRYRFHGGFQGDAKEDWRARIPYPTKALSVTFRFPSSKLVSGVKAFLANADGVKLEGRAAISDANPIVLHTEEDGRQIALWAALNIPGNHTVLFEWTWADRTPPATAGVASPP